MKSQKSEFALAAPEHKDLGESGLLVPQTLFYANAAHAAVLSDIFTDFELGEHLLLMGNQGLCSGSLQVVFCFKFIIFNFILYMWGLLHV